MEKKYHGTKIFWITYSTNNGDSFKMNPSFNISQTYHTSKKENDVRLLQHFAVLGI
jgi:hypothetical protein